MFRRRRNPFPLGTIFLAALTGAGATAGSVLASDALRQKNPSPEKNVMIIAVSALSLAAIAIIENSARRAGIAVSHINCTCHMEHVEAEINC